MALINKPETNTHILAHYAVRKYIKYKLMVYIALTWIIGQLFGYYLIFRPAIFAILPLHTLHDEMVQYRLNMMVYLDRLITSLLVITGLFLLLVCMNIYYYKRKKSKLLPRDKFTHRREFIMSRRDKGYDSDEKTMIDREYDSDEKTMTDREYDSDEKTMTDREYDSDNGSM